MCEREAHTRTHIQSDSNINDGVRQVQISKRNTNAFTFILFSQFNMILLLLNDQIDTFFLMTRTTKCNLMYKMV